MDREFLSNLDHDLCYRPGVIKEALEKKVQFGTKEFFVYSQLRWYETDGKFGYCVAGTERLGEDVGMSSKEVEHALRGLKDAGLVEHVWCNKKVYCNKTKIWISTVRLAGVCTNVDAIRVLKKGKKNITALGETSSGNEETSSGNEDASPVRTEVGNTKEISNEISIPKGIEPKAPDEVVENSVEKSEFGKPEINNLFKLWEESCGFPIKNKIQLNRFACQRLLKSRGIDAIRNVLKFIPETYSDRYAPTIKNFMDLEEKWDALRIYYQKCIGKTKTRIITIDESGLQAEVDSRGEVIKYIV